MRKSTILAISTVLILSLVGCNLDLTQQVYTSDVREVAEKNTKDLTSLMSMRMPIPDSKECDKHTTTIVQIIRQYVPELKTRGCKDEGMRDFLLADAPAPIEKVKQFPYTPSSLFNVAVHDVGNGDVLVGLSVDRLAFREMEKAMSKAFPIYKMDSSEMTIKFEVNHDERKSILFRAPYTFLNGEPNVSSEFQEVKRRELVRLRLSDVQVAFILRQGLLYVFRLRPQAS